jgi:hypothetical protein
MTRLLVTVMSVALTLVGCSADFDPYTRLTSLRVLAVQSDPVAPASGETATLTAMIYTPAGDTVVEQRWSWCPFAADAGEACPITEDELRAQAGADADTIPPYDLGAGATASFPYTIPTRVLDAICAGTPGQPALVDCLGGFPVQIRMTVRTATDEVSTVRRLRLRRADDTDANTNPTIDALSVVMDGDRMLTDAADVTVPREVETPLRVAVSPAMSEPYRGEDFEGNPADKTERLTLTWFVESGDTNFSRTGYIDGLVPLEEALEVDWEPATIEDFPGETSRVIVVLRDDREGVSWRTGTARLGGAP